ncbi:hypothetical protein FRC02_001722 [Tulasnella sp. 418]|nr:hypothetical protein FRC02_001722 [Tulasnella sp. 418]
MSPNKKQNSNDEIQYGDYLKPKRTDFGIGERESKKSGAGKVQCNKQQRASEYEGLGGEYVYFDRSSQWVYHRITGRTKEKHWAGLERRNKRGSQMVQPNKPQEIQKAPGGLRV